MHYGDKDNILPGSKFYIYGRKGNLVLKRDVKGDYEPGTILLNNGAFIISPSDFGAPAKAILEQLDGSQKIILDCKKCDMIPSGHTAVARKAPIFVSNLSGIGVILYDDKGEKLWEKKIKGHANTIAISDDGQYISAMGSNEWGSILTVFDKNGHELWKKKIGAATNIIKFSPHDNILVTSSYWYGLKCFELSTGNMLWTYNIDKFTERDERGKPKSSMNSLDISSDGSLVSSMDSKGKVYLFSRKGDLLKEIKFGDTGNIKFSNKDRFLLISAGKKIYCYEIKGVK